MSDTEGGCLSRGAAAGGLSKDAALRALGGSEPSGVRETDGKGREFLLPIDKIGTGE